MDYILNIDASTSTLFLSITLDGVQVACFLDSENKNHVSSLQPSVDNILKEAGVTLQHLKAIAVGIGPGSYTGLRIALASAKGYAFGLNIPIIGVNTLELLQYAYLKDRTTIEPFCTAFFPMANEIIFNEYNEDGLCLKAESFMPYSEFNYKNHCLIHLNKRFEIDQKCHHYDDFPIHHFEHLALNKFKSRTFDNILTLIPSYIKKTYLN